VPGAGKSTVAAALAKEAELPVFDKDDFLEPLFASSLPNTPLERRQLSHRADRAFQSAVEASMGAIVVSWWKHPKSDRDSGTPTEWLRNLPGDLVEVYCKCAPQVAMARFLTRKRHPGHLDGLWSRPELFGLLEQASFLGPLAIGRLVEVDSSESVNCGALWTSVKAQCQ
jgi:gluconate kinase